MRTAAARAAASVLTLMAVFAAPRDLRGQEAVSFEQLVADLSSPERDVRLRAASTLKDAGYDEAAVPLATAVGDEDDRVQSEAIAGELNIYLAEGRVSRRRVGLVIEVRDRVSARSVFADGPRVLDPRQVPAAVLVALRRTALDANAGVAAESLYAFGALSANVYGADRVALLDGSAPELSGLLASRSPEVRTAAVRVIARMYERRPGEGQVDQTLGDSLVTALNDDRSAIRRLAVEALGALTYERAVAALTDVYQHYEHGPDASAALTALARIAHPSSMPLFEAALVGRDPELKRAAIEGLARSGDASWAPRLASAVADERRPELVLAGHFASAMLADGSIDRLVDGLTRAGTRERAAQYLIEVAPGRSAVFSPHMPDPVPALRADLLDIIGLSGDQAHAFLAELMLQDPDPGAARAATRAVLRLMGQTGSDTR